MPKLNLQLIEVISRETNEVIASFDSCDYLEEAEGDFLAANSLATDACAALSNKLMAEGKGGTFVVFVHPYTTE